jgi:phosphoribosyl-ATP pyrophosphohydrolase
MNNVFEDIYNIICSRKIQPKEDSYVSNLFSKGKDKILEKIVEEAGEVIIAAKNDNTARIIEEIADLWFHTLILLSYHDITPEDIYKELIRRKKPE